MKHYVLLFIVWPFLMAGCQFWQEEAPVNPIPVVRIDSPASNARFSAGEEIEIKSTANDDVFVQRVELYANGQLVQKDLPPIADGQKTFTVLQRWLSSAPQIVELRVIAYDNEGAVSYPAAIMLEVVAAPSSLAVAESTTVAIPSEPTPNHEPTAVVAQPPPTEEAISEPPPESTAVPLTIATEPVPATVAPAPAENMPIAAAMPVVEGRLTSSTPLNIYSAPNAQNDAIGTLNPNDVVIGIARSEDSNWIKIVYGATNREGWVSMEQFVWRGDLQALAVQ